MDTKKNNQIIKQITHKNKQSGSEDILWWQVIKHYYEIELIHNNEYKIYHMHIK